MPHFAGRLRRRALLRRGHRRALLAAISAARRDAHPGPPRPHSDRSGHSSAPAHQGGRARAAHRRAQLPHHAGRQSAPDRHRDPVPRQRQPLPHAPRLRLQAARRRTALIPPATQEPSVSRPDGRAADQLRPVVLERQANPYAEGSCLIRMGGTLVHCTASVEPGVPPFKKGTGEGWVTAEYAMLPRATVERTSRERNGPGGRTQEIQRLIGRSLRAAMSTMSFGEFTIRVDCDVLQADGGTRTASITGGCVALADACQWLAAKTKIESPFGHLVSAISVGIVDREIRVDLAYLEDRDAGV